MIRPRFILVVYFALTIEFAAATTSNHSVAFSNALRNDALVERANITHYFIEKIFQQFGHNDHLDYRNFLSILHELGLERNATSEDKVASEHQHRKRRAVNSDLHQHHVRSIDTNSTNIHQQCLSGRDMLRVHHLNSQYHLGETDFLAMCPALIQQILSKNHCLKVLIAKSIGDIPASVWLYSTCAVCIISLVGLLGVAVIPVMQKVFYNHLLQFLVALAVGALSGDALLHLLPHALEGVLSLQHNHGSSAHDSTTLWIGVTGLCSIFFFFLMERILTIITRIKNSKKKLKKPTTTPVQSTCLSENIKMEDLCRDCEKVITMMIHPNKELVEFAETTLDETETHASHDGTLAKLTDSGHSHAMDGPPNSVSSVAWMVILGDGIHNFSDGLAIGAGFASSITVGVSTSIAVFCHELPHEIGDFAVLLRAGMRVKQAVVYNCLSSFLCFIGMLIGVAIGNISTASLWIFAAVAGMFLYIALVDMLPEMTAVNTKEGENQFFHLFLQCFGMLFGSSIMFLIAFYEDSIKNLTLS